MSLQFVCLAVPSLGSLLGITAISWLNLIVVAIAALLPLIINEAIKTWGD